MTNRRILQPVTQEKFGLNLGETLQIALDSLAANRVRSFLTMLGVIIGVASVVSLMTIGAGAGNAITGQVTSTGTNVLTIMAGSADRGPGGSASVMPLTMDDYLVITRLNLPVVGPAPVFNQNSTLDAPAADTQASIVGTTASYEVIQGLTLAAGTFLSDTQIESNAQVIVLGATLKNDLFGSGTALGEFVRVSGKSLRVIGVIAEQGGSGFGSIDDQAFVPITLAQKQLFSARTISGELSINNITLSVTNTEDIEFVQSRIESALRDSRNVPFDGSADNFRVMNQAAFLDTLSEITSLLTTFLGAIAGISLLVGGIGIMNIMLVSVTERTREIGLRRSVGAPSRAILLQFMIESIVLSLFGGILGILFGMIPPLALSYLNILEAPLTINSIILSLTVAIFTGLFFGIWPARRAANLNPIDALRHE